MYKDKAAEGKMLSLDCQSSFLQHSFGSSSSKFSEVISNLLDGPTSEEPKVV